MIGPGAFFIVLVIAAAFTLYHFMRSRHLENMARIEHGFAEEDDGRRGRPLLTLGLLLCFLAGGFLAAYGLTQRYNLPEYVALPTCLLLAGGLGLIVSYVVHANAEK